MNLQELMIEIKRSPESFLQDDCIFQLRAFIRGFIFSKNVSTKAIDGDHKLLESIDSKIRNEYGIGKNVKTSIEEILNDIEGENAYKKYIELWFKYVQQ